MKTLLFILLFLLLSSCATTQKQQLDEYAHITIPKIQESCTSEESYYINVLGMPGTVIVFDNCLKINKILVVIFDKDFNNTEIRQLSGKLASVHYINYLDQKHKGKRSYSLKLIKASVHEKNWVILHEIKYQALSCTSTGCRAE